jgi:AhpD family alkylhydroperoxidase
MKLKHVVLTLFGVAAGAAGAYVAAQAYRKARATCPPFRRRIYASSRELIDDFRFFWDDPSVLADMRANARITPAFGEKLMLAVTGVNGCRYCSRLHARTAEYLGVSTSEATSLLRGEIASGTVEEAPALFFAQHYAEHEGQPDPELLQRLVQTYDERTARDILNYLRLFTMSNLVGNTLDALVSRLLGKPSAESTLRDELAVVLTAVFGIGPLVPVLVLRASLRGIVQL